MVLAEGQGAVAAIAPYQAVLVIVLCAFGALIAHQALAVFNDGARPFMLDFIQGRSTRIATATIVFGLSAGFIFGLGAPMALSTGVLNPWLVFLPVEILGLLAPWKWLAGVAGAAWGAVCAYGLAAANTIAHSLPVDFITALQEISTPILWLFAIFPVLAISQQFGKARGLVTFLVELVLAILTLKFIPSMFAGTLSLAAGVILLLVFAVRQDVRERREKAAELAATPEEDRQALADMHAEMQSATAQIFGPNAMRLRKHLPWFAILGGLVCALAASGDFGGGEATSFLVANGQMSEAAQVDFIRVLGFVPLIATTALASGAYAMAGFTLVYPVGYLLHALPTPIAIVTALIAGAVIFSCEVLLLSVIGRWLEKWPTVRASADHIRDAITEALGLAILIGSLMAANAMGGGLGILIVGGLYLLNEATGRPVVRLAAGPAAVIVGGVLLNLLHLMSLLPEGFGQ